ncbi:hypothetical protein AGDE_14776 [Angomonas deanei]|nr:hypothetical protein AGDE_14776 [Angomonas deanei]|eukprot:EPY20247.1 hypothetical protein AGDE_14776 [Angomonas deanei]
MTPNVLGGGVHNHVDAVVLELDEVGGTEGVVDHYRDTVLVGDGGDALNVRDVDTGVTDGLEEDGLGLVVDGLLEGIEVLRVDEVRLDGKLALQTVVEEGVRTTVQRGERDDLIPRAGKVLDGVENRRHAGRGGEGANPTLQSGHALLKSVSGRVRDAGVDVAGDSEVEHVGAIGGVVKDVAGGLVDGDGTRLGAVDHLTSVDLKGIETVVRFGHEWCSFLGEERCLLLVDK